MFTLPSTLGIFKLLKSFTRQQQCRIHRIRNGRVLHGLFQFSAFSLQVFLFLNRVYMQETRNIVEDRCTQTG